MSIEQKYNLDASKAIRALNSLAKAADDYVKGIARVNEEGRRSGEMTKESIRQMTEYLSVQKNMTTALRQRVVAEGEYSTTAQRSISLQVAAYTSLANSLNLTEKEATRFFLNIQKGDYSLVTERTLGLSRAAETLAKTLETKNNPALLRNAQAAERSRSSIGNFIARFTGLDTSIKSNARQVDTLAKQYSRIAQASGISSRELDKQFKILVNGGRVSKEFAASQGDVLAQLVPLGANIRTLRREQEAKVVADEKATRATLNGAKAASILGREFSSYAKKTTGVTDSSSALGKRLEKLVEQYRKVVASSGQSAIKLQGLNKAIFEQRDLSGTIIGQNKELAASYVLIRDELERIYRARLKEQALANRNEKRAGFVSTAVDFRLPSIANNKAFTGELQNAKNELTRIANAARLSKTAINEMITNAALGRLSQYSGAMDRTYSSVRRVIDNLRALTKAKRDWAINAVKNIHLVNVSWRSYLRYFITRIAYRAFINFASAVREGIRAASELAIRISEVRTIAQESTKTVGDWSREFLRLSNSFPESTLEIAEAAYQALSNQVVNAGQATEFLREALRLSNTTMARASEAVNALSSVINSYGLDASQAGELSAQFFKIVELGRIRLGEIANDIGNLTVIGNQMGVSFAEIGAGLTTITRQGVKTDQAMTLLRNVMLKLIKPTKDLQALFESEFGVSNIEQAVGAFGLAGVFERLEEATRGSATEIAKLFSRIRATVGATSLFGGENRQQFESDLQAILFASTDSYGKAVQLAFDTPARRLQLEVQKIKNYFVEDIGFAVLAAADNINTGIGGATNVIAAIVDEGRKLSEYLKLVVNDVKNFAKVFAAIPIGLMNELNLSIADVVAGLAQAFVTLKAITVLGPALSAMRTYFSAFGVKTFADALYVAGGTLGGLVSQAKVLVATFGGLPGILTAIVGSLGIYLVRQKQINELQRQQERGQFLQAEADYWRLILQRQEEAAEEAEKRNYFTVLNDSAREARTRIADYRKELFATGKETEKSFEAADKAVQKLIQNLDNGSSALEEYKQQLKAIDDILKDIERRQFGDQFEDPFGANTLEQNIAALGIKIEQYKIRAEDLYSQGAFDEARQAYAVYTESIAAQGRLLVQQQRQQQKESEERGFGGIRGRQSRQTRGIGGFGRNQESSTEQEIEWTAELLGLRARLTQSYEEQARFENAAKVRLQAQATEQERIIKLRQEETQALQSNYDAFKQFQFSFEADEDIAGQVAQARQERQALLNNLDQSIETLRKRGEFQTAAALELAKNAAIAQQNNQEQIALTNLYDQQTADLQAGFNNRVQVLQNARAAIRTELSGFIDQELKALTEGNLGEVLRKDFLSDQVVDFQSGGLQGVGGTQSFARRVLDSDAFEAEVNRIEGVLGKLDFGQRGFIGNTNQIQLIKNAQNELAILGTKGSRAAGDLAERFGLLLTALENSEQGVKSAKAELESLPKIFAEIDPKKNNLLESIDGMTEILKKMGESSRTVEQAVESFKTKALDEAVPAISAAFDQAFISMDNFLNESLARANQLIAKIRQINSTPIQNIPTVETPAQVAPTQTPQNTNNNSGNTTINLNVDGQTVPTSGSTEQAVINIGRDIQNYIYRGNIRRLA